MKKTFKIVFIIIILLLLFILLFAKSKLSDYKSVKEIYELCQNINNYNNLHLHDNYSSNNWYREEYGDWYWKDNICVQKSSELNGFSYRDKQENLSIIINDDEKQVKINENETNFTQKEKTRYVIDACLSTSSEKDWSKYNKYKFCGTENINNQECYKVNIKNKLQNYEVTYWIEKDKGLILKREDCWHHDHTNDVIETRSYSYEFDAVTDTDIEKPDIKNYEDNGYEIIYE